MDIHIPTVEQLKKALHLHEGIELLKAELAALFGHSKSTAYTGAKRGRKPGRKPLAVSGDELAANPSTTKKKKTKRVMSPEAREKIAAAQRKRWAKTKRAAKKTAGE